MTEKFIWLALGLAVGYLIWNGKVIRTSHAGKPSHDPTSSPDPSDTSAPTNVFPPSCSCGGIQ